MKTFSTATTPTLTLHARVREQLRASIVDGSYGADARLPAESALSNIFGVSRITVRHALSDLQNDGTVIKVAGKGTFVAPRPAHQQLTRLEGFGEAMGRHGRAVRNAVFGHVTLPAPGDIASRLALAPGTPITQITRVRYLDGAPVSYELTHLHAPLGERLRGEDLAARDIFVIFEDDYGITLGHADLELGATLADAACAAALEVAPGTPILRIQRLTHDAAGKPIDFEYLHFRGDTFQYRLRLDRRTH